MMMDFMKKGRNLKTVLALMMITWTILPVSGEALAAGRVELDRKGEMNLTYTYDGQALSGADVRIYRTADITETGRYVLSGDFRDYPVNLENLAPEGWRDAANTLDTYVTAYQLEPLLKGTVDALGNLNLGLLDTGLYLTVIEDVELNGKTYHTEPFLTSMPSLDEEDRWNYDVTIRPKSTECTPVPQLVDLTVIKVWNDGRQSGYRPQEIKVSLFKDNEMAGQVTLSASNYWRHTWSGLDGSHSWKVVEADIPSPYTVTYTSDGTVYTITNSIHSHTPGGNTGTHDGGGNPPSTTKITEGDIPLANMEVPVDEIPEDPVPLARLPKTGLLWWPVPFLVLGGMMLLGLGYKDYYNGKRKKDEK